MKPQPKDNIFENHVSDTELVSRIHTHTHTHTYIYISIYIDIYIYILNNGETIQ